MVRREDNPRTHQPFLMEKPPSKPWFKTVLTAVPSSTKFISASSLGGRDSCRLRSALSSLRGGFNRYSPPNGFSSWGIVFHALREKAFTKQKYDLVLAEHLDSEDRRNSDDWLRARLVPLSDLPQIREKIAIDQKSYRTKLADELVSTADTRLDSNSLRYVEYLREKQFPGPGVISSLPFRGRADCIVRWSDGSYVIRDHKSGSLFEPQTQVVKKAFVLQLHAYALLATECFGIPPKHMELVDDKDMTRIVDFNASLADAALDEAFHKLSSIDEVLNAFLDGMDLERFSSPSPESCEYCAFKPYCPSYWRAVPHIVHVNPFTADFRAEISSMFSGYSQVGSRAVLKLKVGPVSFVSLLVQKSEILNHPVLFDWVAGLVPVGTVIYVLSARPTSSRTQFALKDDSVVCTDGY